VALTPALELAIGEQGAGVRASGVAVVASGRGDRSRSQVRAQRDGGKEVAHRVAVAATILGVAEAQLADIVASCSHGLQSKQRGLGSPAKLWFQIHHPPAPNLQSSHSAQAMSATKDVCGEVQESGCSHEFV